MTNTIIQNPSPSLETVRHWSRPLEGQTLRLEPLTANDFEKLFAAASDPEIWAGHPNRDRWTRAGFGRYFDSALAAALQGGGAYVISDQTTGETVGSSRFYAAEKHLVHPALSAIVIGYTFLVRKLWGQGANRELKALMMRHAFERVQEVQFHVHTHNVRSQTALTRLGIPLRATDPHEATRLVYAIQYERFKELPLARLAQDLAIRVPASQV